MNTWTKVVLLILNIQLSLMSYAISKLCYNLGYANGRIHTLTTFQPELEVLK